DADNNKTTYGFDAADQQTTVGRPDSTTLVTDYWPDGSIKDTQDGAQYQTSYMTSYSYDAQGRETSVTDPDHVTGYGYDAAGRLTAKIDGSSNAGSCPSPACTTFAYDPGGRLTSVTYGDGRTPSVSNIAYDNDGRRTGMTDGSGTSMWS